MEKYHKESVLSGSSAGTGPKNKSTNNNNSKMKPKPPVIRKKGGGFSTEDLRNAILKLSYRKDAKDQKEKDTQADLSAMENRLSDSIAHARYAADAS